MSKLVSDSVSCPTLLNSSPPVRPDLIKEGHLWVKLPPGARGSSWKVWTRKYVIIKEDVIATADSVTNCVLVCVFKTDRKPAESDKQPKESELMFKKWFTPQTTVVFRCKSRTQLFGFTCCIASEPAIHFGAGSESESQNWMYSIRTLLWPPNPFVELGKTLGSVFEISIIDNEFSHRAGLLGMYGHLGITSKKVILSHPQTGHVVQEWYLSSAGFKLLPQTQSIDESKVLTMITDAESSTGYGTIVFYCAEGNQLIKRIHEVRQMFNSDRRYGAQVLSELTTLKDGDKGSLAECYSLYQVPNKEHKPVISLHESDIVPVPKFVFNRPLSDPMLTNDGLESSGSASNLFNRTTSLSPGSPCREFGPSRKVPSKLFSWSNCINIPESMLDCSISSTVSFRSMGGRPMSSGSSSSDADMSKVEFYIGDDLEKSQTQSHTKSQVKHESYAEEDEDMYAEFHQAIAEENDVKMIVEEDEDTPPPLPPKKSKKKLSRGSLSDVRASEESQDLTDEGIGRKRSLTLNVLITK